MDIKIQFVREAQRDDVCNPVDINSARRDICCHDVAVIRLFQLLHRLPALARLQAAVDFDHRHIRLAQSVGCRGRFFPGIGEDQADIRHKAR